MSVEANKTIIRRFIETWNAGDLQGITAFWSPDIIHHTRADHDLEDISASYQVVMQAFPDLQWQIDDIIAEGDKVVTRLTGYATHQGSFMGVPPTGKRVKCKSVDISRIADGKIVEHWGMLDELYLMEQLDLIPSEYLSAM